MKFVNRLWPWKRFADMQIVIDQLKSELAQEREDHRDTKKLVESHVEKEKENVKHMRKLGQILAIKAGITVCVLFSLTCFGQRTQTIFPNPVHIGKNQNLIFDFGTNWILNPAFPIQIFIPDENGGGTLPYSYTFAVSTNSDNTLDATLEFGMNQNGAGSALNTEGGMAIHEEFHFIQNGTPVKEWKLLVWPTNLFQESPFSFQLNETNGNLTSSFSFDTMSFFNHTNGGPTITFFDGWVGGLPLHEEQLNNGSFLSWTYPNGNSKMFEAQDSGGNARTLMSWSASCGGTGCLFVGPNGDFASVQQSVPFYLKNQPFGLSGNSSLSPQYIQVNGQVMTATGGITAGGTADPGAGNIQATNSVDAAQFLLLSTNYVAANFSATAGKGKFVMSNNACYFITATRTTLIAQP